MNIESKEKLQDSGYSRIANILSGLVPTVKTFGILTTSNPQAEQTSAAFNNEQNEKFEHNLRHGGYGFIPIKSHYREAANSYFLPNITKDYLMKLGTRYKQVTVIFVEFGVSEKNENGSYPFTAEMIKTYPSPGEKDKVIGNVLGLAEGFINADGTENFTEVKGRMFDLNFLFDCMPDIWIAEYGALKIRDTMPIEFIEKLNQKSDHARTSVGMYGWACQKSVQTNLYRFDGKELPSRKVAVVEVKRPVKPFANRDVF